MSDYIRREDVLGIISSGWSNHYSCKDMCDGINELPTVDEKEIIRKAFERVVESLELLKYRHFQSKTMIIEKAIEIVEEECGISE